MKKFLPFLLAPLLAPSVAFAEADLVAWWPLDEITGSTTPDVSGGGNDLTIEGDMDAESLIDGRRGKAFAFDGLDDMLTLFSEEGSDLPIIQHPSYSIGLWVRGEFDNQEGGGDRRVFSESSDASTDPLFNIGTKNDAGDATVDVFLRNDGGLPHQFGTADAFDGDWHHITLVVEEETMILYVDGTEDVELDFYDAYSDNVNATSIGGIRRADPSHWFTGDIDDVAVFKSALTGEEITALMDGSLLGDFDPDADDDGMRDTWETANNVTDPAADPDADTLTNLQEHDRDTDPNKDDTDGDDLKDNIESGSGTWVSAADTGTDPRNPDTDDDGLLDGVETNTGTFVDAGDTGTDPLKKDTDGDGFADNSEIQAGTDPTDAESTPDPAALLVAWWQLDQINGTTTPDSGPNGYDMELNDMDDENLVPGKFGSAMSFDGTAEMLTRTSDEGDDLPISQHEQYTVALWVKGALEDQAGNDRRVFSEASDSDGNPLLNIGTHNTGADATVDIYLRNDGSPNHQHSFEEAFDGEWHHIVWVRDDEEALLYVDGELDDQVWEFLDTYSPDVTNTTSIGGILRAAQSHWFAGEIDEVAVFKSALSADLVAQLTAGTLLVGEDPDKDKDGLPDAWETANGVTDPAADEDEDGLTNLEEFTARTDPKKADTDGDGLSDKAETNTGAWVDSTNTGTDPRNADTDGDSLSDGAESNTGTFTSATNTGTSPLSRDSDADGFRDSTEIEAGTDPTDASSKPSEEASLVAYWPLDEVSGDITPDASGNGYDMSLLEMSDENLVAGRVGNAMEFINEDGTMLAYVSEDDADSELPISQHEAWTISMWTNIEGGGQNDLRVFSEASDSNNDPLLNIGTHNGGADGTVDIYLRNLGNPGHQHSITEAYDTEWHHTALVWDGEELLLYVDGELDEQTWTWKDPYSEGVTNTTTIGGILRASPSHWVTGLIDEVSVWKAALGASKIAELASGEPVIGGNGLPFQISDISYDPANRSAKISWASRPGQFFAVERSTNMEEWLELTDGLPSDGDSAEFSDVSIPEDVGQYYYRVRVEQ